MQKKIIIAPLNWGLGHATRCIPIIKSMLQHGFTPVIASDGNALNLLRKEFPTLESIELPSYDIKYGKNLKLSLLSQTPKIFEAVKQEEKLIAKYISENNDVIGIISDNRFGVRNDKVFSVYITHQLNVLSGWSTFLTSKTHQNIINKFDECWIPDEESSEFSGKLSESEKITIKKRFIGVLSRFSSEKLSKKNDILIILSGLEPNRTQLEEKLLKAFKNDSRSIVLVQGKVEKAQKTSRQGNVTVYNYLLSQELQREINQSELIMCRSGYSSIMDLAVLGKKAFFIPTKGQNEQEYLAEYLESKKIAPFCSVNNFSIEKLKEIKYYTGFAANNKTFDGNLKYLFKRK